MKLRLNDLPPKTKQAVLTLVHDRNEEYDEQDWIMGWSYWYRYLLLHKRVTPEITDELLPYFTADVGSIYSNG